MQIMQAKGVGTARQPRCSPLLSQPISNMQKAQIKLQVEVF